MDIEPNVLKEIERHQAEEKSDIDLRYKQVCNFFKLCESPLEQQFLFYILDYDPHRFSQCRTGYDPEYKSPALMCRSWQLEDFHEFDVKIFAQHVITRKDMEYEDGRPATYRTDFLFELSRDATYKEKIKDHEFNIRKAEVYAQIVIEIDGHDFHERTKEQAQRDKSRDRYLTAEGYTVFRFTGSEVYRDIYHVADEVEEYLLNTMVKVHKSEVNIKAVRHSGVMINVREVTRYFNRPYGRKNIRGI